MGQDLTGKWKGYFTPSRDLDGRIVTYEIVIKENPDHTLTASTYSKISNNFTANALATGMHSENTQLVSITETTMKTPSFISYSTSPTNTPFISFSINSTATNTMYESNSFVQSPSSLRSETRSVNITITPYSSIIPSVKTKILSELSTSK